MTAARWLAVALALGGAAPRAGEAQTARFDIPSGDAPHSRACMLLERTIFKMNVLTLELRFGPETADRIRRLVEAGAERDAVATAAMESRDALFRSVFHRDIGLDRYLEELRANLRLAAGGGVISWRMFREVSDRLPEWYGFLEGRGVVEGDAVYYRIRGDTLDAGHRAPDGGWLLQRTKVGPDHRRSVLGSYLAPGTDFRRPLLADLVSGRATGCPTTSPER